MNHIRVQTIALLVPQLLPYHENDVDEALATAQSIVSKVEAQETPSLPADKALPAGFQSQFESYVARLPVPQLEVRTRDLQDLLTLTGFSSERLSGAMLALHRLRPDLIPDTNVRKRYRYFTLNRPNA